ncbi:hypothetical protein PRVXH_002649 [Proteinivorax hydrogeniformans]|uniref:Uncharacterized protein n=1 Tax=Proteinivorax hydrogeniformans TaxID=1826727 RepID=A0AAU8HT02_9FIRM
MSKSRLLKWVIGVLELLIGISILGDHVVFGMFWVPVLVMLALHILSYFLSKQDSGLTRGNGFGMVAAVASFVPILRNILRILTAIFVLYEAATPEEKLTHNIIKG